jgi:hypothetical protein
MNPNPSVKITSEQAREIGKRNKGKKYKKSKIKRELLEIVTPEEVKALMSKYIYSNNKNEQKDALKYFGKFFTATKIEQSGELNQNVKIIFENVGKQAEKKVE